MHGAKLFSSFKNCLASELLRAELQSFYNSAAHPSYMQIVHGKLAVHATDMLFLMPVGMTAL